MLSVFQSAAYFSSLPEMVPRRNLVAPVDGGSRLWKSCEAAAINTGRCRGTPVSLVHLMV